MKIIGWIRKGDKASCGGAVIEGDEHSIGHGRPYAYQGAKVTCRKSCVIVEGHQPTIVTNGRPRVIHGMKTSGGCPLISTLNDIDGIGNSTETQIATAYFQPAAAALAAAGLEPEALSAALANEPWVPGEYDDRYVLLDISDGKPLAGVAYAIEREDGSIEHGTTDDEGHTHLLNQTLETEHVRIYLQDTV